MRKPATLILLLLLLLSGLSIVSGCGKPGGIREGDAAPGLTGIDPHGNRIDPAQYRGKVVVLYFWRNSCCENSLEPLDRMYAALKDRGMVIIADNAVDSREDLAAIAQRYNLKLTLLYDEGAKNQTAFGVFGYPTLFIIDRDGVIRKKVLGAMEPAQLRKLITPYVM